MRTFCALILALSSLLPLSASSAHDKVFQKKDGQEPSLTSGDLESGTEALVCFEAGSGIPSRVRESLAQASVEDSAKSLFDEDLLKVTRFTSLTQVSVEHPELSSDAELRWFEVQENETPHHFIARLASRFERTVPWISQMIRVGLENWPQESHRIRGVYFKDHAVAPINEDAERYLFPDRENCIVIPISKIDWVISPASGKQGVGVIYYDRRILKRAQDLEQEASAEKKTYGLTFALLFLEDVLAFSFQNAQIPASRKQIRLLIQTLGLENLNLTVEGVLTQLAEMGWLPSDGYEHSYFGQQLQRLYDELWNAPESIYHQMEQKTVSQVHSQLPVLSRCKYFNRAENAHASRYYDCQYLMKQKIGFFGRSLSKSEIKIADDLLSELQDYEVKMQKALEEAYRSRWQSRIYSEVEFPGLPQTDRKKVEDFLLKQIQEGKSLPLVPNPTQTTQEGWVEKKLSFEGFPVSLNYFVPMP